MFPLYILCAIIGYLLGSISVSVILSKLVFKEDVRKKGSGNAGATNMARVYGMKGGLLVLLGDFSKAMLTWLITYLIGGASYSQTCVMIGGITCVLGHAFPVFFNFRGGKGVSVGAAIALMVDWKALLFIVIIFIVVFAITKIVSISSISGAFGLIFITVLFYVFNNLGVGNGYFASFNWQMLVLAVTVSIITVWLHRANIVRLLKGEEKKFSFSKKPVEKNV
ncbi:MAG: glycerol-3-phosphate 1-O-acyltransferase PlsY [Clostridiales bacterium]|nr:glycerol-3-phosphate 1-O-acyltransferase PlsY [Clostridiales bacterium]